MLLGFLFFFFSSRRRHTRCALVTGVQTWSLPIFLATDLGLNPTTAGTVIRINLPALTEERRKELSKLVHNEGENTKIAIRNIRRDAIGQVKDLLKEKEISEDDERRGGDEIQKLTDQGIKDVDEVVKAKEQELMAV